MSNKNGVEKEMNELAEAAKKAWEQRAPSAPSAPEKKAEPRQPATRPTTQSIDDEDRAAGEGMGQAKYGPPPSAGTR